MSKVKIRTASLTEVPALLAFWARSAEGASITDDVDGVTRLLVRDPDALLVAESDGGAILGTVIAGYDGWRCHLYRLAVDPGRRRQGIAAALLAAAHERFVALGGRRADAMVLDRNELAQHAWRNAGYDAEEQWSRWVRPLS
ncbi:GNAT family N-acetyltransferase [Streptomyces sp. NPDC050433]|uniref:GNAT family N-acetyltransferase n=1 Tax=Streptomyces sp. NPDC050433 TaxID=3365615 RepID=UPI0037904515